MKKVSQKRFNTLLCYISTEDDMPTITTQQAALCYIPKFSEPYCKQYLLYKHREQPNTHR